MKSLYLFGLAAATSVASSAAAGLEPGDMITLSRIGLGNGHAVMINYDATRTYDQVVNGPSQFALAGTNVFAASTGGRVKTFCVELNEGFEDGDLVYTATDLGGVPEHQPPGNMTMAKQVIMQDLYARWYDSIFTHSFTEMNDVAAAFQLLVWEISHESFTSETDASSGVAEMSLSAGAMAATDFGGSAVSALVQDMIDSLGDGGFRADYRVLGLTNPDSQDMLIVVPSPAVIGLAGLGLVGLRRRRR